MRENSWKCAARLVSLKPIKPSIHPSLAPSDQKHVVQRKEITNLEASNLSIMPTGFEALPESDLASLLEYLASGTQAAKK